MGKNDGVAYTFYPTGWIHQYRYFEKNKKNGYGEDYFKKGGLTEIRYFIKDDKIQYKRIFDSLGHVVNTEANPWFEANDPIQIKE